MESANLWRANLRHAQLDDTTFSTKIVLPDAEPILDDDGNWTRDDDGNDIYTLESYWTPDTDMSRYTDSEHPDFWLPPYLAKSYDDYHPRWVTDEMLVDDAPDGE